MWDMGKIDFHLITMTDQITHGYVKSSTMPIEKYFAIVYGLHTVDDRKSLWSQLMTLMPQVEVEKLDLRFSDYSLLRIDFAETVNNRPRPFKFLNHSLSGAS